MIKRKVLSLLIISSLLFSFITIPPINTFAENTNGVCEAKEYIIELEDNEGDPYDSNSDFDRVVEIINNPPADRTGWSAVIFEYRPDLGEVVMNDGSITYWHERAYEVSQDSRYNTKDSWPEMSHDPTKHKNSIIGSYGEDVYTALIKSGQQLIPIYGDDYEDYNGNEYYYHSFKENLTPKKGDRAFSYYNNKVEVKFVLDCEEEIPDPEIPCLDCEVEVPTIGNGGYCTESYIPEQIEKPFVYELDLITERIEGKTVDIGKQTLTPVTVYRADFSDLREAIKKSLKDDLKEHEALQKDCEKIIRDFENELKVLQQELSALRGQLASAEAAYSSCLDTRYPIYDEDGDVVGWERPDCSGYASTISSLKAAITKKQAEIREKEKQIRLANVTLKEIGEVIEAITKYISIIEAAEAQYETISTKVALKVDGVVIETKNITLKEDERLLLKYIWTLKKDSLIKAIIDPDDVFPLCEESILEDPCLPCEISNDNNEKETPIYISTHEAVNSCSVEGTSSTLKGIVRTIQEGDSPADVENVYEHATSFLVIDPNEKNRRAGYGFHYKVYTVYVNDDISDDRDSKGVTGSSAFKPEILASYLPYSYKNWQSKKTSSTQVSQNTLTLEGYLVPDLENTREEITDSAGATYFENKEWELPQYSVEQYSGNVFEGSTSEANNHIQRDGSDALLDGGRKWYLDWYQPDGSFSYDVLIEDIGVNRLTLCNIGEIEVKGTSIGDENGDSDFVFRFVDAANPFPGGTGWNWIGSTSIITSLRDWWENWNYPDPKTIPSNYHQEEYRIEYE